MFLQPAINFFCLTLCWQPIREPQGRDELHGCRASGLQPLVHGAHHRQPRAPRAELVHQPSHLLLPQLQIPGGVPGVGQEAKVVAGIYCSLSIVP